MHLANEWRDVLKEQKQAHDSKRSFAKLFEFLGDGDFWTAPASTRFHSNFEGGLAYHSMKVAKNLELFTSVHDLEWDDPLSPYVIGLCHDVCKTGVYKREYRSQRKKRPDGTFVEGVNGRAVWEDVLAYTFDDSNCPMGHGAKSVILTQKVFELTEQEVFCILWHMGGSEYGSNELGLSGFGTACAKDVNVLWTHVADRLAALEEDQEAKQALLDAETRDDVGVGIDS